MEAWSRQFNIYLTLAATLALLCGCETDRPRGPVSTLRVHIEANSDTSSTSETISVLRATPVLVTIAQEPVLTEANIVAAKVIDTPGGFAVEVQFDETGTLDAGTIYRRQSRTSFRHLRSMGRQTRR